MMARRHNQMNYKTICLLVAVLLLSQWFSLVHATDHFLVGDEPDCHVCQLNSDHGQATAVVHAQDFIPAIFIYDLSLYEIQI